MPMLSSTLHRPAWWEASKPLSLLCTVRAFFLPELPFMLQVKPVQRASMPVASRVATFVIATAECHAFASKGWHNAVRNWPFVECKVASQQITVTSMHQKQTTSLELSTATCLKSSLR